MNLEKAFRVGQWLKFKAGTCFGEAKDHLGFLVAVSDELAIGIAINATSNVDGVVKYAIRRNFNPDETVVVIGPDTLRAAFDFSKETAFDCNRPSIIKKTELDDWINNQKVELLEQNVDVNDDLLTEVKNGILKSPLVSKKYKNLIEMD